MGKLIKCPFCGEEDFDKEGLKIHFQNGWCEKYNKIEEEIMGTNYYLKLNECKHCDRYEEVHIGKRSSAGRYCFDCGISMCVDGEDKVHSGSNFNKVCYKCKKEFRAIAVYSTYVKL